MQSASNAVRVLVIMSVAMGLLVFRYFLYGYVFPVAGCYNIHSGRHSAQREEHVGVAGRYVGHYVPGRVDNPYVGRHACAFHAYAFVFIGYGVLFESTFIVFYWFYML